jgi:FMN reductase
MKILAVDASPGGPGKTSRVLQEILAGATEQGAETVSVRHDAEDVIGLIAAADGVVFGSPTYRASPTAALRLLLERIERGAPGTAGGPLHRTPVMAAMTGASSAHFLGTREISNALSGFFGVQVLSPDVYVEASAFTANGTIEPEVAARLRLHGAALTELAQAVARSRFLRCLAPWR